MTNSSSKKHTYKTTQLKNTIFDVKGKDNSRQPLNAQDLKPNGDYSINLPSYFWTLLIPFHLPFTVWMNQDIQGYPNIYIGSNNLFLQLYRTADEEELKPWTKPNEQCILNILFRCYFRFFLTSDEHSGCQIWEPEEKMNGFYTYERLKCLGTRGIGKSPSKISKS